MTLAKAVYLICDGRNCCQMTGQFHANDAREARQIAKSLRWKRIDGRDLCKACARAAIADRLGVTNEGNGP